jgi:hypothetical protein
MLAAGTKLPAPFAGAASPFARGRSTGQRFLPCAIRLAEGAGSPPARKAKIGGPPSSGAIREPQAGRTRDRRIV